MNDNHDTPQLPPIQLLITACPRVGDAENGYSWLHGYCIVSCSRVGGTVHLTGHVQLGEPYHENYNLVADLAKALDPRAVLAGLDLHDMVSRLSRLPIGTKDQGPALALLAKLQVMLAAHRPIDLALDDDHERQVATKVLEHKLSSPEVVDGGDAVGTHEGFPVRGDLDNGNPHRLALGLADAASAAILALGDLYLEDELQPKLLAEWRAWRHSLSPSIGQPKSAFAIDSSN